MKDKNYVEEVLNQYKDGIAMLAGIALAGYVGLYSEFSRQPTPEGQKPSACEQVLECRIYESVKSRLDKLFE